MNSNSSREVRGKGLLLAIEFDDDIAKGVALLCLEQGLLVNNLKPNLIRLIPPLIVTAESILSRASLLLREP